MLIQREAKDEGVLRRRWSEWLSERSSARYDEGGDKNSRKTELKEKIKEFQIKGNIRAH